MKKLFSVFVITISFFACSYAYADDFAHITYDNLVKSLIRYGALDIKKNDVIDEYSILTECKLYKHFYNDDFKWQEFRQAMRKKIDQEVKTFPTGYRYNTIVNLDRYDFEEKLYRFTNQTKIDGVVSFLVTAKDDKENACEEIEDIKLPRNYRIIIDNPIYLSGLPFGEAEAKALLKRLEDADNKKRSLFISFDFRITYVAPVTRKDVASEYGQRSDTGKLMSEIRLDAKLNSINFYEDPERTKLLYVYRQ